MIVRKLALRNVARRKAEALLVVAGAMLGTAIITGSLVFGDSLDASIRAKAPEQLGPVDMVIRAATPEDADAAGAGLQRLDTLEGVLKLDRAEAAVTTGLAVQPRAQILEVDFAAAAALGADPAATGFDGAATPAAGTAAAGADLAEHLGVETGDRVVVHAYGSEVPLAVEAILPRVGVAGFWLGFESTSMNLFVAPGTLADLHASAPADVAAVAPPPERLLLVSAPGDVFAGAARAADAMPQIDAALAGLAVEVDEVKQALLDDAEATASSLGELFLAVGSFAVLAGVLLLVNLFVMLAEERKRELGMLRAVGLRRRTLVAAFALEGLGYAVASSVLGALSGLGVGWAIVQVASRIFSDFDMALAFAADPVSVAIGGLAGFAISALTVLGASARIARLNIIRAVRDLPEPQDAARRRWVVPVAGLAAALFGAGGVAAIVAGEPIGTLLLPAAAAVPLAALLGRLGSRRLVASGLALAVLFWGLVADRVIDYRDADIFAFVAQGVVLVAAAVVLVAHNQHAIAGAVARLAGRRPVARLGLAYPLARRARTALTLGMYSLVVFTLVFISVMARVWVDGIDGIVRSEAGGFDIVATTPPMSPLSDERLLADDGVRAVAQLDVGYARATAPGSPDPAPTEVGGFDAGFVAAGPPLLDEWDTSRHATERAVWEAVLADPGLMVAGRFFLMQDGGPQARPVQVGDAVTFVDPASGAVSERTVAAVAKAGIGYPGALMSVESAAAALHVTVPARSYLRTAAGADADAVAQRLQAEHLASGLEARTFDSLVSEMVAVDLQFFQLLQGYLALGLVVGIAGVGVVMFRAVRERRREIGMLRSLGLRAGTVRNSFLLEAGYVTVAGIVIGATLSLVTAYRVIVDAAAFGDFDTGFTIPWPALAALAAGALLASLAATAVPARRAARIHPAVALRVAD